MNNLTDRKKVTIMSINGHAFDRLPDPSPPSKPLWKRLSFKNLFKKTVHELDNKLSNPTTFSLSPLDIIKLRHYASKQGWSCLDRDEDEVEIFCPSGSLNIWYRIITTREYDMQTNVDIVCFTYLFSWERFIRHVNQDVTNIDLALAAKE